MPTPPPQPVDAPPAGLSGSMDVHIARSAARFGVIVASAFFVLHLVGELYRLAAVSAVCVVLNIVAYVFMLRGAVAWGRMTAFAGLLVVVVGLSLFTGGLRSPAVLWLLLMPTVVTDSEPRKIRAVALLISLILLLFGGLEWAGHLPASDLPDTWVFPFLLITLGSLSGMLSRVQANRLRVRQTLEAQRAAMLADLEQARARSDAANEAKTRFLAHMSHEIRTPLNGVIGLAELLRASELNDVQRRQVDMLASSGEALLDVIDEILDLSKIEADHLDIVDEPFDPVATVNSAVELLAPRASVRGLTLTVEHALDVPRAARADGRRIRQIVINLLSNALKFTDKGTVSVRTKVEQLPSGTSLAVSVEDTGVGIRPEVLARLFQPFAQGDATTTRRHGGSGLGLVISKRLAALMGGEITVRSQPGVGSAFTLTVPIRDAEAPVARAVESVVPGPIVVERPRVLVAEDNLINLTVVVAMLEELGCVVDSATDGREAVEAAEKARYDLILMDCMMPVLDGVEATRRIRAVEPAHTLIVALTANALTEQRDEALAAGMDAFLTKPVHAAALRELVDRARRPATAAG